MNDVHYSSKTVEWETPQDLFDELNKEFQFTLDACATPENAKCEKYFTLKDNGLAQRFEGERVWINPPYGRHISRWIQKAATEPSELTVMLLPARTDTEAWHAYIFGNAEVRFLKGRLKFGGGGKQTHHSRLRSSYFDGEKDAPFASAIVIFGNYILDSRTYICYILGVG